MVSRLSSIRSRVLVTLIGSLGLAFLAFVLGIGQYVSFVRWTTATVESTARLAEVPLTLSRMVSAFETYTSTGNQDFRELFWHESAAIQSALNDIHGMHRNNPRLSAFQRSLHTMFDYYRSSAGSIIELSVYDAAVYSELRFLRLVGNRIILRAQELVVGTVDLSSEQHAVVLAQTQAVVNRLTLGIVSLFVLLVLGSIALIRDLSAHLDRVEQTARRLSLGDWNVPDLAETRYGELSSVADAFNEMKHNIIDFVASIEKNAELDARLHREQLANAEKEKLLRQTQLNALQQQINPHFLFNTLNLISRTAMFNDTESTIALVEAISRILRFNLDNGSRTVQLSQELEILHSYIFVQETRFEGRVKIVLSVDQNVPDLEVPPMILQPLVENSIIHGLKNRRSGATVRVAVICEGGLVRITISDNGCGISRERMRELEEQDESAAAGRPSIGLANVRSRLHLAYGDAGVLSLDSAPGKGTKVTIRIPIPVEVSP